MEMSGAEEGTLQFDVHASQITQWSGQLMEGATAVFGDGTKADAAPAVDVKVLHAKIGGNPPAGATFPKCRA